jgi:putative nucleotidyltransferase with HDIG domain
MTGSGADTQPVRRDAFLPWAAAGGAAAILPPAIMHATAGQTVSLTGATHFWAVVLTASLAVAAGVLLSEVGRRRCEVRPVLIGTAFTVMASLLFVHGLASPGFLTGMNGVVGLSGAATLPVGGAILVLAAFPGAMTRRSIRWLLWLQGALMVGIVALGVVALAWPTLVPDVPEPRSPAAFALLAAGFVFYGAVGLRALRTVLLARRRADLLVVVGLVWMAASLVPALTMDYRDLGWWVGHFLEVAGILCVALPVSLDLFRTHPTSPLLGDLPAAQLVREEEAFLGSQVRSLMELLVEKDAYTEEHTRRVALLAVQVGEELGLPPQRLRTLAIGGLLHDIGKLAVPDEILKKPGPLTDEEFRVIQRHPLVGERLLDDLGFSKRVRRLVRDHHERVDGSGYPHGRGGEALDLDTRILAVCDVYDALRSNRVYRDAWPHERAIGLLRELAGVEFDRRCVLALDRVLAADRPELNPLRLLPAAAPAAG